MLLFAPLLWFTGRRRAAAAAAGTFAACTALAWAALPRDSWTYWVHHLAGAGLGGRPDSLANQSLHGALLRFGLERPAGDRAVPGARRGRRWSSACAAPSATPGTASCCSPSPSPAASPSPCRPPPGSTSCCGCCSRSSAGSASAPRTGCVWPVAVVLAMTLPADDAAAEHGGALPVRDNVVLLAALAAACAVPFLPRTSPYFRAPVPTEYALPAPARWRRVPLLPFWRRVLSRPNLLLELLLIRVGYSAYSHIRARRDRRHATRAPRSTASRSSPSSGRSASTSSTGSTTRW